MKSLISVALIVSVFFINQVVSAQTTAEKEAFDDAEYFFAQEDYTEALASYMKLYKRGFSENANVNYKMGICYLHTNTEKSKAIQHLEKAALKASEKYSEGSIKEENAPIDVFLFLGNAYRIDNQLGKAIDNYTKYLATVKEKNEVEKSFAKSQIEACNKAKEAIANPAKVKVTALPGPINTNAANYNPVITPDENYMVYVTRLKLYDAVMAAQRTNGKWGVPDNITPDIQSDGDQFPVFISQDRNTLLLVKQDNANSDIYISKFDGRSWSQSHPLNKEINTKYWESHASITGDGKTIFFTSNRPQSIGGMDIFYSTLNAKGDWGPALNIGAEINTTLNEETPFISPDGRTLYFSSQGYSSIGGYDIYVSEKDDSGHWSKPENMNYPINSTDDDLFFSIAKVGAVAYQSKDMKNKGGIGDLDIAKIEMFSKKRPYKYSVNGSLGSLLKDSKCESFKLKLIKIGSNNVIDSAVLAKDGSFIFECSAPSGSYNLMAFNGNASAVANEFVIPNNFMPDTFILVGDALAFTPELNSLSALSMANVDSSSANGVVAQNAANVKNNVAVFGVKPIVINNILFPFNGSELSNDAIRAVDSVVLIMKGNSSLIIEAVGYADSWGVDQYNVILSENRAKAVKRHITKRGVSAKRIHATGKGEINPIAINVNENGTDNPEGRAFNRRVEFAIVKCDNKNITVGVIAVPDNLKIKHQ